MRIGQRMAVLAVLALALAGCALGLVPTPAGSHHTAQQALDLVRLFCTLALAFSLLLGPGVAWRAARSADRPLSLAFLPLPGLVIMIGGGGLAWALADRIGVATVCFALFVPLLLLVLGTLLVTGPQALFTSEELRVLLVVGCVLGLAVSRSLWSLGPEGELYAGTISRTLEVGDRSDRAAYFAVVLAGTTPFLVHEVWFTWPKMTASAMVLLGAICVIQRRPLQAGLLSGFGYLMHPGALLAVPTLGLIALWPLRGARWKQPRVSQGLGSRPVRAGPQSPAGLSAAWVLSRLQSVGNTLVPVLLPLTGAHDPSINVVNGTSPPVIHFFFQYWNTLPFGFAIFLLPLLVVGLWRAGRRWPWPVVATVIVPFAFFAVYWGSFTSGLMREGLQTWALTLCAVIACQQAASGFGWLRSTPIRLVLVLRVVEVLAMAIVPTVATRHELISARFASTDTFAVAGMLGFGAILEAVVWKAAPPPSDIVSDGPVIDTTTSARTRTAAWIVWARLRSPRRATVAIQASAPVSSTPDRAGMFARRPGL